MMIQELTGLIGLRSIEPVFTLKLQRLGFNPAAMKVDEHLASIIQRTAGMEIALEDEAMFSPKVRKALSGIWVVVGVHMHAPSHEGFEGYKGELPFDVAWKEDRTKLHQRLGAPEKSGGGNKGPGKIVWPYWDIYRLSERVIVRMQYDGDQRVELVTVCSDPAARLASA
jgi:hypothetical protein